jgi:hypothetical protein
MPIDGSNDNYHHISANNSGIRCSSAIALSHTHKSVLIEMFDVWFAMLDVSIDSRPNPK